MVNILLLGASGQTGKLVADYALSQKHTITALVRDPSALSAREGLTLVKGTPLNKVDIDKALAATQRVDAVIVTLGILNSPFSKLSAPEFFLRDSVRNVIEAMREKGVRRLAVMSVFGVGTSAPNVPWLVQKMFDWTNMSHVIRDHNAVDEVVRGSDDLAWTLVRPPMLKDGEAKSVRECGEEGSGMRTFDSVTRQSVAKYLVDAVERTAFERRAVAIAN